MLPTNYSFYAKISEKSLFASAKTYDKYIFCKERYCIVHHDNRTCFLPTCIYHILLPGVIDELPHKSDSFCFTYQHVNCLYTLFKYPFNGKIISKSGKVFDKVQKAIFFNQRNRGMDKMPSIAKKRLVRKMFKLLFMSALQKNKSTQTSGSVFAERIEKAKKTKFG